MSVRPIHISYKFIQKRWLCVNLELLCGTHAGAVTWTSTVSGCFALATFAVKTCKFLVPRHLQVMSVVLIPVIDDNGDDDDEDDDDSDYNVL